MGITGLLPFLKDITYDVHLRSFSGIDVYCWLHKTVIFCVEEIILGIETTQYVSSLHSYMCLKCLILNVSFSLVLFSPQTFFRYIDMCMKDTDLLIKNNVQPILDFQKKLERKANVESSSANLLLLRTISLAKVFYSF